MGHLAHHKGPVTVRRTKKVSLPSAHPERKLSPNKGRRHLDRILIELKSWTTKLEQAVRDIEDKGLQFAVAFLLDVIADEDDCGSFLLTEVEDSTQLKLESIHMDQELLEAMISHCGVDTVQEAHDWFLEWIRDAGPPVWWLGWRFEHIDIQNKVGLDMQVEIDHVVYCFRRRRTIGVTLWDGPRLDRTTILPLPSWRNA